MLDRIKQLVAAMSLVEFSVEDLESPHSLNINGDICTLKDWIDQEASESVRAAFGRSLVQRPSIHVRSVCDLNEQELQKLSIAILQNSDDESVLTIIGVGSFAKQQRIEEVSKWTTVGQRIANAFRLNARLREEVIALGKVGPRIASSHIKLSDFDF